jgi:hypothetical protein
MILSSGFNGDNVLRELKLTNILEITEIGWDAIFNALKSPHCSVENLDLSYNEITGTAAHSRIDALTNCTTIKVLGIAGIFNSGHSRTVLQVIVQLLRSPRCILECLDLRKNYDFDGEGLTSLTDVLANNSRLRELDLSSNRSVYPQDWGGPGSAFAASIKFFGESQTQGGQFER